MPHTSRKRGESGFYHVVSKGDGGQYIFESTSDRTRYLTILTEALDEHRVELHAYCLMSNHVHLLVRDTEQDLSAFMKRVCENYAAYFKWRTGRVGHVFQCPFWSEPIESDEYFLCALRYIHANPEPALICKAKDYPWSSYQAYLHDSDFVTTEFALEMLGGAQAFEKFSASGACFARPFPTSRLSKHLNTNELAQIALEVVGRTTLNAIRTLPPNERRRSILLLRDHGFTEAEITRATGLGATTIHRALETRD